MQAKGWVPPALPPIDHSPYIVDLLSVGKVVIIRFQIPIRASRQTFSEQLSLIISSKVLIRNFDTFVWYHIIFIVFLISVIKGHLYTQGLIILNGIGATIHSIDACVRRFSCVLSQDYSLWLYFFLSRLPYNVLVPLMVLLSFGV